MKNIIRVILVNLFISIIFLSSCSNDDSAHTPDDGITTGNYLPLAENNKWWYKNAEDISIVYLGTDIIIDGLTYFRTTNTASEIDSDTFLRKAGASYFQRTDVIYIYYENGDNAEIDPYEIKILKDDLQTGEKWTGNIAIGVTVHNSVSPQKITATLNYTGTVLERNSVETIEGVTYTNVIKIKLMGVQKVGSETQNIQGEYWFAKDIGIIFESSSNSLDNITRTKYLTSYEFN